jgi:hypothetical protein
MLTEGGADGRTTGAAGIDGLTTGIEGRAGAEYAKPGPGVGRETCGMAGEGAYECGRGVDGAIGDDGDNAGIAGRAGAAAEKLRDG